MSLLYGIKAIHQSAVANRPHILGHQTARAVANDTLLEIWNGPTNAGIKAAVDKDGKIYSAALTAGDLPYAVAGGVANVRRLDSLAIGAANTVLTSSGAAPQWSTSLSLASTLTVGGLVTANAGATVAAGQILTLTGATVAGAPTWSSSQAITVSTAAQPNITSVGTLTGLTVSGVSTFSHATGVTTNTVTERTAAAGVTVDGVLLKDAGGTFTGTLALAGATVSGQPTWSSAQAITLSTAAQPNVTSLGILTALSVSGAITGTVSGIILSGTVAKILIDGPDATVAAGEIGIVENNGNLQFSSRGTMQFQVDNDSNGVDTFGWGSNGSYSNLMTLAETGVLTVAGGLTVTAGGITVTAGNLAITAGNLTFAAASAKVIPGVTSILFRDNADANTNLGITDAGVVTIRGGLTVAAGNLALAGVTVTGAPTWGSGQAITLTTAAQPNITSLGTLTVLDVAGALTITKTTTQLDVRYDGANHTTHTVSSVGGMTVNTVGAGPVTYDIQIAGTSRMLVNASGISVFGTISMTTAVSQFVPGATSLSLRNNANTQDNLIITDAGAATFRSTVGGITTLTATTFKSDVANAASAGVVRLANNTNISWRNAGNTGDVTITVDPLDAVRIVGNLTLNGGFVYQIGGTQVLGARITGYVAMTGAANKAAAYDVATVTLAQLAGRVAQLQADITTHGAIGA